MAVAESGLLPEITWSLGRRLGLVGEPGLGGDQGRRFQDSAPGRLGDVTASCPDGGSGWAFLSQCGRSCLNSCSLVL